MARRFYCGTPEKECNGTNYTTNAMLTKTRMVKLHPTRESAFACFAAHLISTGYERIGSREFKREQEPILVLCRRSTFGTEVRLGKNQEGKGNRFMPLRHRGFIHVQ